MPGGGGLAYTVYLRGQVAQDLDTGENLHVGNPAAQAEQVMTNVQTLLTEARRASVEHIVSCTVYLTDASGIASPVYRVLGRRLKGVYPVFTGLVVSALARPEWLVEVTQAGGGQAMTFSLAGRCERDRCGGRRDRLGQHGGGGAVRGGAGGHVGAVCSQSTTATRGCARRCSPPWPTAWRPSTPSTSAVDLASNPDRWRTGSWRPSTPTAARPAYSGDPSAG